MDVKKINVANAIKNVGQVTRLALTVDLDVPELMGKTFRPSAVCVDADCSFDGEYVCISGCLNTTFKETCSRCAREFDMPFSCEFSERFKRFDKRTGSIEDAESPEDDFYMFAGEEIDLTRMLRETILLNAPLYTLCSENCKGLCQTCGHNLNDGPCACDKPIDAPTGRFAQLLLDALDDNKNNM